MDRLMSAAEAAQYLGISTDTLYRRREEWGLPAMHVGRELRFRMRDIDRWLERNRVK